MQQGTMAPVSANSTLYGDVTAACDMGGAETAKAQACVFYPLCAFFQSFS